MKKLEYFWVSLKNLIFLGGREGGGGFTKRPIYRGNCPKRGGDLDSWQISGRAWQERGGGVFERGVIPQCAQWLDIPPAICKVESCSSSIYS